MMCRSVDLPEPERPTSESSSPGSADSETPRSTGWVP